MEKFVRRLIYFCRDREVKILFVPKVWSVNFRWDEWLCFDLKKSDKFGLYDVFWCKPVRNFLEDLIFEQKKMNLNFIFFEH